MGYWSGLWSTSWFEMMKYVGKCEKRLLALFFLLLFAAGQAEAQCPWGGCDNWMCPFLAFGVNNAGVPYGLPNVINDRYGNGLYGSGLYCTTTCTCPDGTSSMRIMGNYNTEPVYDKVSVGGFQYSGSGNIDRTFSGRSVVLDFTSNAINSYCDFSGYGSQYTGAQITTVVCMTTTTTTLCNSNCGDCCDWACKKTLAPGPNTLGLPHVTAEYYNNMECDTTCYCPAGTGSVTVQGTYDIEPGGLDHDYVYVGDQFYSGGGAISKTVLGDSVPLFFSSDWTDSRCDFGGYGFPYQGVTINKITCNAPASMISLDVGNDTIIDLQVAETEPPTPIRTRNLAPEINHFVHGGCWCSGCFNTMDGYCLVPVVIESNTQGNLTINDIRMEYYSAQVLANVSYGNSFRNSKGWCWFIWDSPPGFPWHQFCVPQDHSPVPFPQRHFYIPIPPIGSRPPNTNDAIDDAVYRLLNESLDKNQDGIIDISYDDNNMKIQTEDKIGVQTLWGPLEVRLIVWS